MMQPRKPPRKKYEPSKQQCIDCGIVGGHGVFTKDNQMRSGLKSRCSECDRRVRDERYAKKVVTDTVCKRCGKSGGSESFRLHRTNLSGLNSLCRVCESVAERERKYGGDLGALVSDESPQCEICGDALVWHMKGQGHSANIDHCHTTGKVRGVLCRKCNTAIGLFKDNPALLWKAAVYLGGLRN